MKYTIISPYNMRLRAAPSTSSEILGLLYAGLHASGDELIENAGDQWLHVLWLDNKPVDGWIAVVLDGEVLCTPADQTQTVRQYYRLRWDFEASSEFKGRLRAATPCPAVLNFQQMQHNPLTDDWARFFFSLNTLPDDMPTSVRAWNGYANSKAFLTDGWGMDKYRNVITGENLDKPLPRIETKGCAGNVVCVIGKPKRMWRGEMYVEIETLDISKAPPFGMTNASDPHLIHHATVLTRRADGKGGYVVNPFPHLGGRDTGRPVYFPLVSHGAVYYPVRFLQKLPLGAKIPNPYNPPMEA